MRTVSFIKRKTFQINRRCFKLISFAILVFMLMLSMVGVARMFNLEDPRTGWLESRLLPRKNVFTVNDKDLSGAPLVTTVISNNPVPVDEEADPLEEWKWRLLPDRELAVYSAYLDYQDDLSSAKQVLVMGVLNRSEERSLYCHLITDSSRTKNIATVGPVQHNHIVLPSNPEEGDEVFLHCPLENITVTPVAVQVSGHVGPPPYDDEKWIPIYSVPRKTLNIVWCIGPLYDNYDEVQILVEQLEWAKLQGIDRVIAYVDTADSNVMAVLKHYEQEGFVQVIDWSIARLVRRNVYYLGQIGILNDCVYRNKHRANYVFLYDVDERVIDPHNMYVINKINAIFKSPSTAVALIKSAFFHRARQGSSILTHSHMKSQFYEYGVRSKMIVRPQFVNAVSIHDTNEMAAGCTKTKVNESDLFIAHFRFETTDIEYSSDFSLPEYIDILTPLVAEKMKLFG